MNSLYREVCKFFDEVEIYEDIKNNHIHKIYLKQSICAFLENETMETAFNVFKAFFDIYKIKLNDEENPFIDILDILKNYESNAAVLIDKQRDHYIHTINVFVLGLAIFANNKKYRESFNSCILDGNYKFAYSTKNEEFLYRWGIASLFHDIGYPIEIVGKQINKFVSYIGNFDGKDELPPVEIKIPGFSELNRIEEIIPKEEFVKYAQENIRDSLGVNLLKSNDLIALRVHNTIGTDLMLTKKKIDDFLDVMGRSGFIDHGYYSTLIVLKWYGYVIQYSKYNPAYFYEPILDSASAIFLHNCYRNMFIKEPFNLDPLKASIHPIAYLLILCDELQEWNRKIYGIKDKLRVFADEAEFILENESLIVKYTSKYGQLSEDFGESKVAFINTLLNTEIFNTFKITTEYKEEVKPKGNEIVPRPSLDVVETLARLIHKEYYANNRNANIEEDFDKLPETLKYSNLRQAMAMTEKMNRIGYVIKKTGLDKKITEIPSYYIEDLAREEHDSWMRERIANGWTYGPVKDVDNKKSPYLVPYDELTEEIKQLDRNTIISIPKLLEKINFALYEK